MKITFLGAAQEVTGSKYLVEHEDLKILVDCGLFQGLESVEQNKRRLPVDVSTIHAVLLTHAHIDHSGYIPALVKQGFHGKIYCTKGTYELCKILLPDCASILEEEAEKQSNGVKVLPLYTKSDALHALKFFQTVEYEADLIVSNSLKILFHSAGHIVGASFITISDGQRTLSFSGDLGRFNDSIMKAPLLLKQTDFLVMESTYGSRLHEQTDFLDVLGNIIHTTIAKKGVLLIPAFAVGRAQTMLYCLYQLKQKKIFSNIPIFLDSPTAIEASHLLCNFPDLIHVSSFVCDAMLNIAKFTTTVQQSKVINHISGPMIIISASGMAEGGRVLHHLKHFISDEKNTILFVGYQAQGTRGYDLIHGTKRIQIENEWYNVHANIKMIDAFSAHADYKEILEWLGYIENKPQKIFLIHGQTESCESLKKKIEERFGWSVVVPKYLESFELE